MFAFFTPGPMEICIIAIVAVLLFGARLPSLMSNVGKSISTFKQGLIEGKKELQELENETAKAKLAGEKLAKETVDTIKEGLKI